MQLGPHLLPNRLFVAPMAGVTDRPSTIEVEGKPAEIADHMPMILVNPEITPTGEPVMGPEGCLSFPEVYADITRKEFVEVKALNEKGKPVSFRAGGLLSRAVQHEVDHLNGILFLSHLSALKRDLIKRKIRKMQKAGEWE